MNRKQKAMEERFRNPQRYEPPMPRKKPEAVWEKAIEDAEYALRWGRCEDYREYYENAYKNGAKVFDKAMEYWNSPLMRALR